MEPEREFDMVCYTIGVTVVVLLIWLSNFLPRWDWGWRWGH